MISVAHEVFCTVDPDGPIEGICVDEGLDPAPAAVPTEVLDNFVSCLSEDFDQLVLEVVHLLFPPGRKRTAVVALHADFARFAHIRLTFGARTCVRSEESDHADDDLTHLQVLHEPFGVFTTHLTLGCEKIPLRGACTICGFVAAVAPASDVVGHAEPISVVIEVVLLLEVVLRPFFDEDLEYFLYCDHVLTSAQVRERDIVVHNFLHCHILRKFLPRHSTASISTIALSRFKYFVYLIP